MKKNIFLLLAISCICQSLIAQDNYIEYYHLVRKANDFVNQKRNDSALIFFQQAFEKASYIHNKNLKSAIKAAKKRAQ